MTIDAVGNLNHIPKIIFKATEDGTIAKSNEKDKYDQRVTVEYNNTTYNNSELFEKYLKEEILPELPKTHHESMLVMDHAAFHKTNASKLFCDNFAV